MLVTLDERGERAMRRVAAGDCAEIPGVRHPKECASSFRLLRDSIEPVALGGTTAHIAPFVRQHGTGEERAEECPQEKKSFHSSVHLSLAWLPKQWPQSSTKSWPPPTTDRMIFVMRPSSDRMIWHIDSRDSGTLLRAPKNGRLEVPLAGAAVPTRVVCPTASSM